MYTLLLTIIYMAFIGLGLSDTLLSSAWVVIREDMDIPLSFAGILTMIMASGTILASLLSDRITKKFGAGLVVSVSVAMTAFALFGFSVSGSFWLLCIFAVPYGIGAGSIDAALNNYVALHYTSRHMNWLHCFWGVGAAVSPFIMGYFLIGGAGWNSGYRTIFIIQAVMAVVLFLSLPLWKKRTEDNSNTPRHVLKLSEILRIKGVKFILPAFFGYCAMESTAGLWASSFLVLQRGIAPETAARYAAFFYLGVTAGRFLCGFVSEKIGNRRIIRIGGSIITAGIIMVWLPFTPDWLCLNGLIIIGFGCAPIYPAMIHSTSANFGKSNSQAIIGVQMASAYTGATLMPPLFGLIADNISIGLYPVYLLIFAGLMLFMTEKLNKAVR